MAGLTGAPPRRSLRDGARPGGTKSVAARFPVGMRLGTPCSRIGDVEGGERGMKKTSGFQFGYWIVALLALLGFQYLAAMNQQIATIPYSQFQQLLNEGKVADVGVSDRFMQGTLK